MTEIWTIEQARAHFKTKPHVPSKKKKSTTGVTQMRLLLAIEGIEFEEEVKFMDDRKFRFDFVIKGKKIALEFEGIAQGKSRHTTVKGYSKDTEKYNLAAINGWTVLRYTIKTYSKVINDLKQLL